MEGRDYVLVEDSTSELVEIGGRRVRDIVVTLGPDKFAKLRAGYLCIKCFEDFSGTDTGAWPEHCPFSWCNFPIRAEQAREFDRVFGGVDENWVALHRRADDAGIALP